VSARGAMIAKVHLGAKDLRLDEDTRRDLMERVTGKRSAADCTDDELDAVLAEYRARGWSPTVVRGGKPARNGPAPARRAAADHPVALKARAMWISLYDLGVVRNSSEAALEAFARRQLGVAALQWADQSMGYRLIEALKAMAERAGWPQDLTGHPPRNHLRVLIRRLAVRQAEILAAAGQPHPPRGDLAGGQIEALRPLIATMGAAVRALAADEEAAGQ
jgi:phage gp16-like protein